MIMRSFKIHTTVIGGIRIQECAIMNAFPVFSTSLWEVEGLRDISPLPSLGREAIRVKRNAPRETPVSERSKGVKHELDFPGHARLICFTQLIHSSFSFTGNGIKKISCYFFLLLSVSRNRNIRFLCLTYVC